MAVTESNLGTVVGRPDGSVPQFELKDADGTRRLGTYVSRKIEKMEPETGDMSTPLLTVDPGNSEGSHTRRLYTSDGDIEVWKKWELPVRELDGEGYDGATFIIQVQRGDDRLATKIEDLVRSGGPIEVPLSLFVAESEDETYREAFERVREFNVVGLTDNRARLKQFLRDTGEEWGIAPQAGLLLEGPPGTGKTELVMEVCREEYGTVPVTISGPEILSRWVGESERILRERFKQAENADAPVLYIDEIDAIARSRNEATQDHTAQIVAQLLVLLDGIDAKNREHPVKVIASTNMADLLDPALVRPGRLGSPIEFTPLFGDDALAVLHRYLEPIHSNGRLGDSLGTFVKNASVAGITDSVREQIEMQGLTGADIEQIVQEGVREAREDSGSNPGELTNDHLIESLSDPSTTRRNRRSISGGPTSDEWTSISNGINPNVQIVEIPRRSTGERIAEPELETAVRWCLSERNGKHGILEQIDLSRLVLKSGEALRTTLLERVSSVSAVSDSMSDDRLEFVYFSQVPELMSLLDSSAAMRDVRAAVNEVLLQTSQEGSRIVLHEVSPKQDQERTLFSTHWRSVTIERTNSMELP